MKPYNLEESIFTYILKAKKTTTLLLVAHFKKKGYTKQGVYKVLRKLYQDGKILWVKTNVEIHLLWLHTEIELLAAALPRKEIVFQEFTNKKTTYKVKTLTELESLYGQIFISLISSLHDVKNFLFYDVHNFTYVNTELIVDWYIDFILKKQGGICLLVGSTSPLDLALKKKNRMKTIDIHCIDKKWSTNISVVGNYIMYTHFDKKILAKMDVIFNTCDEKTAHEPIKELYREKAIYKIVVEENKLKVKEIQKVFKKYFALK